MCPQLSFVIVWKGLFLSGDRRRKRWANFDSFRKAGFVRCVTKLVPFKKSTWKNIDFSTTFNGRARNLLYKFRHEPLSLTVKSSSSVTLYMETYYELPRNLWPVACLKNLMHFKDGIFFPEKRWDFIFPLWNCEWKLKLDKIFYETLIAKDPFYLTIFSREYRHSWDQFLTVFFPSPTYGRLRKGSLFS